jgi:hypothetical protein
VRSNGRIPPALSLLAGFFLSLLSIEATPQELTASALFDLYSQRAFGAAKAGFEARLKSPAQAAAFRREISRYIDRWLVEYAAAFALEAAAAAFRVDAAEATEILELGCKVLRRSRSPTDFELRWHLAANALLNGPAALRPGRLAEFFVPNWIPGPENHLRDSRRRFPNDGRILLAWGVHHEGVLHTWQMTWGMAALKPGSHSIADGEALAKKSTLAAAEAFESARREPSLFHEATVRLGAIRHQQDKRDEALKLWGDVSRGGGDSRWRYFAFLFSGRALAEEKRLSEAEVAYRDALNLKPGAQSARVAVAALGFIRGNREESSSLVDDILRDRNDDDPWAAYFTPGVVEWPALVEAVRPRMR